MCYDSFMRIPTGSFTAETEVRKSRFIATAFPCSSFDDLKAVIAQTRKDNPGANHVVHAAVVGTQFSQSDDHEPKNTAGRPALEVLKGSGLFNVGLTITRYFGGTLLGTGGLVKAYCEAAKAAVAGLPSEEYTERTGFCVTVGYELHESLIRVLNQLNAVDLKETFSDKVEVSGRIANASMEAMNQGLSNISNGQIHIIWC
jgi:uncharacterized YigZ family protein